MRGEVWFEQKKHQSWFLSFRRLYRGRSQILGFGDLERGLPIFCRRVDCKLAINSMSPSMRVLPAAGLVYCKVLYYCCSARFSLCAALTGAVCLHTCTDITPSLLTALGPPFACCLILPPSRTYVVQWLLMLDRWPQRSGAGTTTTMTRLCLPVRTYVHFGIVMCVKFPSFFRTDLFVRAF